MPVSLPVHSSLHDYTAWIETSPDFLKRLAELPQAVFVVDENVWKLYRGTSLAVLPEAETIVQPIQEELKNLETVQALYDRLVTRPAKRNLTLVALGGGILQDLTGFAASTLYRGIHWIYVPTTLLAQADSCVGSKTSLNYRGYKNLLGTFFPPEQIHIYPGFLQTLSEADYYSGFGEVIKLYLMGGEASYRSLLDLLPAVPGRDPEIMSAIIRRSLEVKLAYMEGDEFDRGRRNLLNFGHDFGHALESTSNFAVPHGQAVVFGMLAANSVACRRGLLDTGLGREIAERLLVPNLVTRPSEPALEPEALIQALQKDKKRTGEALVLIMLKDDFSYVKATDVSPDEVRTCLEDLRRDWHLG